MDVKEQEILGEAIAGHWYYAAKIRAMRRLLAGIAPGTLLDVGAGSGVFARALLESGWHGAVCVDPAYAADSAGEHAGRPIRFARAAGPGDARLVLMMDVCEHVADDVGLVAEYARPCRPGTHFLITVPAFGFLFSDHDVFLGHHRRYRLRQLEAVARAAGLEVRRGCYGFAAIFPLAAARRLAGRLLLGAGALRPASDLRRHHPAFNTLLDLACRPELAVMARNRLFGLSAFCLARKPG